MVWAGSACRPRWEWAGAAGKWEIRSAEGPRGPVEKGLGERCLQVAETRPDEHRREVVGRLQRGASQVEARQAQRSSSVEYSLL